MAELTKSELKAKIDQYIYQNVNGEITEDKVNELLKDIVDSYLSDNLSNSNVEISDLIRYIDLATSDATSKVVFRDSSGGVAFEIIGSKTVQFTGTELIAKFSGIHSDHNALRTGNIGTPNQYSLQVFSRSSSSSGVANFKNYLSQTIIDIRQASGNPTIGLYASGAESIFLNGPTGEIRGKSIRDVNSRWGIVNDGDDVVRYSSQAAGVHRFTNNSPSTIGMEVNSATGQVLMPGLRTEADNPVSGEIYYDTTDGNTVKYKV